MTSCHKLLASFLTLPEELIEKICETITRSSPEEGYLSTLKELCLTSKLLDRIARPLLYKDVALVGLRDLLSLTQCLANQPGLAKYMHSLTIEYDGHDFITSDEAEIVQRRVIDQDFQDGDALRRMLSNDMSAKMVLFVAMTESLLFQTTEVTELTLKANGKPSCSSILSQEHFKSPEMQQSVLPRLRHLKIQDMVSVDELLELLGSLVHGQVQSLTCVDCGFPRFERYLDDSPEVMADFSSIRKLRIFNHAPVHPEILHPLVRGCPQLEEFHFAILEDNDGDDDDQDDDEAYLQTPCDIVRSLRHVRKTLKSLSITTESWGDDDGFPSLCDFTALEHLRLDVFELADYEEDGDSGTSSDSDDEDVQAVPNDDHNQALQHIVAGAGDPEWEDIESDSDSSDTNADSDRDSSERDTPCKPFLQLLPKTLKTLWLDNLYSLEGDLDTELHKLAKATRTDFLNFQRITIEGAEELEDDGDLQEAFEEQGIKFVGKPLRHFWYVEEGLVQVSGVPITEYTYRSGRSDWI